MRPPLPWAVALLLAAPLSQAADSPSAAKTTKSARSSSDDSDEGDSGKSGGFFGRLFGKGQEAQAGTNKKGTATPSKTDPKTDSKATKGADQKTDSKTDAKTDGKSSSRSASKDKATSPAPAAEVPKTDEERFAIAKKAASEDPKVIELRDKADSAVKDSEAAKLTRAYLRTLYGKMRTLEPSLKERIDMTEAAALRKVPEVSQ